MKINCIGSGNVAWHLMHALDRAGFKIEQILGRTEQNAKDLAVQFGAHYGTNLNELYETSDLTILAVPDDQISAVLREIPHVKGVLVHTCGSVPCEVLKEKAYYYGVFYPLQTLTKGIPADFLRIPVLVESPDVTTRHALVKMAEAISNVVREADSITRARYQLAAVIANNFSNYLYVQSENYLNSYGLEFSLLQPLIEQTGQKLRGNSPLSSQTGPARRGDLKTLEKHREMLVRHPELKELYERLTRGILSLYDGGENTANRNQHEI